jgi:DNA-directed RNA polymerase subunit RPC12/RpoP
MKKHAPKDVYETRDGYRCGRCGEEVVRFSAPRAIWKHAKEVQA